MTRTFTDGAAFGFLSDADIADAKRKYYAQVQREHEHRQLVRAGLIEQCPFTRFTISDKH